MAAEQRRGWHAKSLAWVSLALLAGGCVTAGQTPVKAPDVPIAFESIDGLPDAMRTQMAGFLGTEAAARQMRLVATSTEARYRVRGYLAPSPDNGGSLTYAWDVFDARSQRAQRVAGTSPARVRAGPEPWESIDEQALRAVARKSLDGIAVFLVASETAEPTGEEAGAAIASATEE